MVEIAFQTLGIKTRWKRGKKKRIRRRKTREVKKKSEPSEWVNGGEEAIDQAPSAATSISLPEK